MKSPIRKFLSERLGATQRAASLWEDWVQVPSGEGRLDQWSSGLGPTPLNLKPLVKVT